jgi:hypothetical protein
MADTISLDALKKLVEEGGSAAENARVLIEEMNTLQQKTITSTELIQRFGEEFSKAAEGAQEGLAGIFASFEAFEASKPVITALTSLLEQLRDEIDELYPDTVEAGARMAVLTEPLLKAVPDTIRGLGSIKDSISNVGLHTGDMASEMARHWGMSSRSAEALIKTMEGFDRTVATERAIIGIAAATGQLTSMFDEQGASLVPLEDEYASFNQMLYNVAAATGRSEEEVQTAALAFGKAFPEALSKSISAIGENGVAMNALQASITLASAYQIEHGDVVQGLTKIYQSFGTVGDDAFQAMTGIFEVAQDLDLPIDRVSSTIMSSAEAFKILGDNVMGVTSIMETFTKAFEESNLSPEGIMQVVGSMTRGIDQMKVGTRAFISAQTGGPGGIAGAIDMDIALMEGRVDEVLGKTMQAMEQQFGGPVLTTEDVKRDESLAGEFYKQVQYLTQVAGIAGSDREAYRILEAMSTGVTDQLELGKSEEERQAEMQSAIARGNTIQERGVTELTTIRQQMERGIRIQAGEQAEFVRSTMGIRTAGDDEEQGVVGDELKDRMRTAGDRAAVQGAVGVSKIQVDGVQTATREDELKEGAYDFIDGIAAITEGIEGWAKQSLQLSADAFDSFEESAKSVEESGAGVLEQLGLQTGILEDIKGNLSAMPELNKIFKTPTDSAEEPLDLPPERMLTRTTGDVVGATRDVPLAPPGAPGEPLTLNFAFTHTHEISPGSEFTDRVISKVASSDATIAVTGHNPGQ